MKRNYHKRKKLRVMNIYNKRMNEKEITIMSLFRIIN